VDVLAGPAPGSDAPLEPRQGSVLGVAPRHKAAEGLQVGKRLVARLGADAGAAIVLDEADGPGIAAVLKVEQNARHGTGIGG
jgi:hypothetical protein